MTQLACVNRRRCADVSNVCQQGRSLRDSTQTAALRRRLHYKTMQIPFTAEQFYGVLRDHHNAVWSAQVLPVALALGAIAVAAIGSQATARQQHGALRS